jgi:CDP-paratose 2-epimerase
MNKKILNDNDKPVLIIGGAGFIGTNLASRFLSAGKRVIIFDNLSRTGVEQNLKWLIKKYGGLIDVHIGDIRNQQQVEELVSKAGSIFNFAAQVAVTTSLLNPKLDFEVNVLGAINLLEAIRKLDNPPPLIFTSTNKVYGNLNDIEMKESGLHYFPADNAIREKGINENRGLSFQSPYGCSKGAADQYILDYARSFNLPTMVFRLSCIYGPHQFGTEDQGWVAHFLIQALKNEPITIYGTGKQVRDILFVDDLMNAFLLAKENIDSLKGEAFNIGGGIKNTISLLELVTILNSLTGKEMQINYGGWRKGDQKYYASDLSKFNEAVGWKPEVSTKEGILRLYNWLIDNRINSEMKKSGLEKEASNNMLNKISA